MRAIRLAGAVLALLLTGAACRAQTVAVYQSEANNARYQGAHQAALREWLAARRQAFKVIGDAVAADPQRLRAYPVVLSSSNYVVPKAACAGLAQYVAQGGRLFWTDTPVFCEDPVLLETLGLAPGSAYIQMRQCSFTAAVPGHPAIISLAKVGAASLAANATLAPAPGATLLATVEGLDGRGETARRPAVILNRRGQGRALSYNWVAWLNREPGVRALLDDGLDLLLAGHLLGARPTVLMSSVPQPAVRQPEPVQAVCKLFRREAGGAPLRCRAVLQGKAGPRGEIRRTVRGGWRAVRGEPAVALARVSFATAGLPDGEYQVRWQAGASGGASQGGKTMVRLEGQRWAALRKAEKARHRMLKPLLAGALGDYDLEPRTPEGRVDIPRLIEQITTAHMNMYDFLVWHKPTDWEDLQRFLPAAREKGIKVWVTLCPPTEQATNWCEPYRLDFIRWADEIGKLSKRFDNLVAFVIDDFGVGTNLALFTPDYMARMAQTLRRHNPRVALLPVLYWDNTADGNWMEEYGPSIDGIVFAYAALETWDSLPAQLRGCRKFIGPDKLLMVNVYASGSSGPPEPGPRSAEYVRQALTLSREGSDGVRIYCLPKEKLLDDYRYAITAELYAKWSDR